VPIFKNPSTTMTINGEKGADFQEPSTTMTINEEKGADFQEPINGDDHQWRKGCRFSRGETQETLSLRLRRFWV
jgi:hypothetical protein